MDITIRGVKSFRGEVTVPGDKSITHRAIILGALAEGETRIAGFCPGDDNLRTLRAIKEMGVEVEEVGPNNLVVRGRGLHGLSEPADLIDAGNSGTTMRLLCGLLSGQNFFSVMTGDASLRRRPMDRVVEPLRMMGARICGRQGGRYAPLAIDGTDLKGISYKMVVASAQVKSALLLAGLLAQGETEIYETAPCRDHTERMLEYMGADFRRDGERLVIRGDGGLKGQLIDLPGDISSAVYLILLALIAPESEVKVRGVGLNPTRTAVLNLLKEMGGSIDIEPREAMGLEPVGDVTARTSSLTGISIPPELIPGLIDEIPALALAASFAEGVTEIRGASELRFKESDRLHSLRVALGQFGAEVVELEDGLRIEGPGRLKGARADSFGDHRIALTMLTMGYLVPGETVVANAGCVDVSFPGFVGLLEGLQRI